MFEGFEAGDWLLGRARALSVANEPPRPLVMGRHLVELGLAPGPAFGPILEECFERQIDGEFGALEQGLQLARAIIAARVPERAQPPRDSGKPAPER